MLWKTTTDLAMSRVHPQSTTGTPSENQEESKDGPPIESTQSHDDPGGVTAPALSPPPPHTANAPSAMTESVLKPMSTTATFDRIGGAPLERSHTATVRAWKLIGKVAMLARNMQPEDAIDIYHDPKGGGSRFMIHPNSKFRRVWDILTTVCVLYVCVMVPLVIGFNYVDWNALHTLDDMIDAYFIIDMAVTLRTGIFSNGEVIMDSKVVLRRYLRTWFVIDIISNFPLALFVRSTARKSIKMVKLQKLPKLLRFGRLLKYLREYAKYYNLVLSFIGMLMGLHFFACLWSSLFSECYDERGNPTCTNDEMPRMYVQSMHNVMLMFLGISESTGYQSISHLIDPHKQADVDIYIMSVVISLFGLLFTSVLFGNILALLISWDQQKAQFRNRMDIIAAEMRYYELPEELQHRVRRNYDYLWINQRAYSDMMLLNQPGISKTLRMTIALHLYKDLVKTVPFFAGSDARFLGKVCLALETAVYLPGDTIIYYDDIGKEMFIVRKGLVEIILPDQNKSDKRIYLRDGNFFGETALVIDVRRTNTVRAVNICDLNVLSKTAFNEIAAEYPEFGERMKRTVIKRQLDNMNIQSPTEKMKVQNQLNMVVEKSLKARRMSVSLRTIYRAKKLGDKLKEIADRAAKSSSARRMSKQLSRITPTIPTRQNPSRRSNGTAAQSGLAHGLERGISDFSLKSQVSVSRMNDGIGGVSTSPSRLSPLVPQVLGPVGKGSHVLPSLSHQLSATTRNQIDAVSRKLSKAEITMDLIPNALLEITNMVNQIKRTTDRLNRRLQQNSDVSDDDDDDGEGDDLDLDAEYDNEMNYGVDTNEEPPPPLREDVEEEVLRRESQSVFTQHGSIEGGSTPSSGQRP